MVVLSRLLLCGDIKSFTVESCVVPIWTPADHMDRDTLLKLVEYIELNHQLLGHTAEGLFLQEAERIRRLIG